MRPASLLAVLCHSTVTISVLVLLAGYVGAEPSTYRAVYRADYKGLPFSAKGLRQLKKVDHNRYLLTSSARSFLASVTESSLLEWSDDKRLVPIEYHYHRKGIGRNRTAILNFDREKNKVRNDVQSKPWFMDVPDDVLDKLGYQLQMRLDLADRQNPMSGQPLSYSIADGGKLKTYEFRVLGEEWTDTPIGRFKTLKVTRVRENKRRTTTFWLAIDWEYLLVRFKQTGSDGGGFEMLLKEAEIGGNRVTGKS